MPNPNRLPVLAQERGLSVEQLVIGTIEHEGSVQGAAQALRVSPNTLHNWLKSRNYRVVMTTTAKVVKRQPHRTARQPIPAKGQ